MDLLGLAPDAHADRVLCALMREQNTHPSVVIPVLVWSAAFCRLDPLSTLCLASLSSSSGLLCVDRLACRSLPFDHHAVKESILCDHDVLFSQLCNLDWRICRQRVQYRSSLTTLQLYLGPSTPDLNVLRFSHLEV